MEILVKHLAVMIKIVWQMKNVYVKFVCQFVTVIKPVVMASFVKKDFAKLVVVQIQHALIMKLVLIINVQILVTYLVNVVPVPNVLLLIMEYNVLAQMVSLEIH
jgi:hypothetical protein